MKKEIERTREALTGKFYMLWYFLCISQTCPTHACLILQEKGKERNPCSRLNNSSPKKKCNFIIYLFMVLRRFQHCTGHITTGSWKGRGNQYIQFVRVLYCKLPTNGKQLPAFPHEAVLGIEPGLRGGRRECYHSATVAPLQFYKE